MNCLALEQAGTTQSTPGAMRLKINKNAIILICIFICAATLRLVFFNGLNWDDDPDYVCRAYQVQTGSNFIYTDNNGFRIGTYYPAALAYALFGINDFSCGFYALVVSLLSIVAVFFLGRLLFNARTGLLAALLLAFYPLDVELASRLMPDGLLSGFSLFAIYFLFKGDMRNKESAGEKLISVRSYIFSGLLLGWCTLVNMSSVVLILFIGVYFFFSIPVFGRKIKALGFIRGFVNIVAFRYLLLLAAFLLVAGIEGACYYKATGDFFFKYHNTLSHYAGNHAFCNDFMLYPGIMFHISPPLQFHFQGREWSYYGFYYLVALPALLYGVTRLRYAPCAVAFWLLVVFCYLQWGSMSFSRYIPFHRLPRHLSIATPPMILCIAFLLGNFKPERIRKYCTPLIILFLVISSSILCYYRHEHLIDSVLPQAAIHTCLESLKPRYVFAADNTIAYQRFLDGFQDRGREYIDIRNARSSGHRDTYAVIGEFRNWQDVVRDILPDPHSIPVNWQLEKSIRIEGRLQRPSYNVRMYRLMTQPVPELEIQKSEETRKFLLEKFSDVFRQDSLLVLSWECARLDGVEELILSRDRLRLRHLEFQDPDEITYKLFMPIPEDETLQYRLLKERGRGEVTITQLPLKENNFTLQIRVDDGPFAAQDHYRFFISADKNPL